VVFVGPVFGNDKVKLLSGADVMVLPSYSEGLPYALLESMAAGVPVIATPVGAIPESSRTTFTASSCRRATARPIAEAIAILAGDREKLSWMSRACRRRVRAAFSIERLAQEFAYHYARLVGHVSLAGVGRRAKRTRAQLGAAARAREARGLAMCGIAGAVVRPESLVDLPVIDRMLDSLAHRGPDGFGTARYVTQAGDRVLLGHRRLAIIDPEAASSP
jgi:hypothetical protein